MSLTYDTIAPELWGQACIVLGFAIWARVSNDVNESIRAQIDAHTFPVHLKQSDWKSGTITWLLDVIAPTRNLAEEVLAAVLEAAPPGPVHIHPAAKAAVGEAWWARTNARRDTAEREAP